MYNLLKQNIGIKKTTKNFPIKNIYFAMYGFKTLAGQILNICMIQNARLWLIGLSYLSRFYLFILKFRVLIGRDVCIFELFRICLVRVSSQNDLIFKIVFNLKKIWSWFFSQKKLFIPKLKNFPKNQIHKITFYFKRKCKA